ncbi:hypothetical protein GQ53DRAFT_772656 [Thozetella sp. PMI_491]|nr:hypothetical protein GQ53DRAFT_772656 [Thozetella sp. PMI_491]
MRRSILALIGLHAIPGALATFTDACWFYVLGIKGEQIGIYYAICGDEEIHTHIDLNQCLVDRDGQLFFQDNGGAFGACTCVSRDNLTQFIDCQCGNDQGGQTAVSVNLDDGLSFDQDRGVLACGDIYGFQDSVAALDFPIRADGTIQLLE